MRTTQVYCDRCGKHQAENVGLVTDTYCDAAGDSSDKGIHADLCPECILWTLNFLVAEVNKRMPGFVESVFDMMLRLPKAPIANDRKVFQEFH